MQGFTRKRGETWTAYWTVVDNGKRVQHSKGGFRHEKAARAGAKDRAPGDSAEEFLESTVAKVRIGTWRPDTAVSVEQLLREHYLPARVSEGLRASTIDQYTNASDAWIIPHLGKLQARQLTAAIVRTWQEKLAASGGRGGAPLSPRSVQVAVLVLKSSTSWAAANGLLQRDVLSGYKRPKAAKSSKVREVWSVEQARRFLESVKDDRMYAAWALTVTYGPRRGEITGVRWPHVHLDEKYIEIAETRVMVDGHPQASTPKTEAGERRIPLTDADVAMLRAHRTRQLEERMKVGIGRGEDGYVFANEIGEPLSPDWLSRRFVELAGRVELDDGSKLPKLTIHGARHAAASVMLSLGLPPEVVAAVLGHSSTVVLYETYRHLFPKETAAVGERMGEALRGVAVTEW